MNYNEFLEQKKQILNNNNVIDMSENNLYKFVSDKLSLSEMSGKVKGHVNGNVHRCHLVEDWLKYFNLPEEFKKYIEGLLEGKIPSTREAGYQVAEQKSIKQIGYELKEVYETVLS